MNALFSRFSLPLLTKELTEQSSRGRTFILRTVYALALYGVGLGSFVNQSGGWDNLSFNILGTGGRLFSAVVQYQLAAIYLLLPMITAGTITSEKERDTLGILLITKLGPWTIVLEKFLSRVVPMLLYILMSLPLLAVAYSLGGVENGQVLQAGVVLVLCVLQVGSLAVLCSAWFRTTPQAVVACYVVAGLEMFAANFIAFRAYDDPLSGGSNNIWMVDDNVWYTFLLPMLSPAGYAYGSYSGRWEELISLVSNGLLPVIAYLTMARCSLWPRAFLTARSWGLMLLRALDHFFHTINQNAVTRGVVIFRDHVPLPTARPLAWRELNKRSLGTTRYLIRFLLLTEGPLVAALLWPLATGEVYENNRFFAGEWALQGVWLLAVFMLLVQSTALVTGERARQTLDVLMSTPMMTRDIVMQKMAGVHYLINILLVPMGTAAIFWLFWLGAGQQRQGNPDAMWQVVRMIAQPLIYLPLVAWGGFYCGLYCKSQTQAMLLGTVILAVMVGLPRILLPMLLVNESPSFSAGFNKPYYEQQMRSSNMDVAWSGNLLQILFPCSSFFDARTTPMP
ncbi:MAG: ABC transporter permease subunit, partial [Planctomycetaceae bacterium]|nr:ABC transporter permease subunit [Planctomycetaceae bacterium]